MSEIFLSYSSDDKTRVRPVFDALIKQGFGVFWDQQLPPGIDWDRWIRDHLDECRCAVVFWSRHAITSANVRHEATIAQEHSKYLPVLLDDLQPNDFPMGLYTVQCANLIDWDGDLADPRWQTLQSTVENKLAPVWMRSRLARYDGSIVATLDELRRIAAGAQQSAIAQEAAPRSEIGEPFLQTVAVSIRRKVAEIPGAFLKVIALILIIYASFGVLGIIFPMLTKMRIDIQIYSPR